MDLLEYDLLAKTYKPRLIKTLLIGEAPPPNGIKYFYKVPEKYSPYKSIESDTSLPATIFNHYFSRRPNDPMEYEDFLISLKDNGIFLIDMINKPLKIRDRGIRGGLNIENIKELFSDKNLLNLSNRIEKLINNKTKIVFLVPRNYKKEFKNQLNYNLKQILKNKFDNVTFKKWKQFRLEIEMIDCK